MTSLEWRRNKDAVADAKRLFEAQAWKHMLAIVTTESPIRSYGLPAGASPEDIARAYGMEQGFWLALGKIESLGVSAEMSDDQIPVEFKED